MCCGPIARIVPSLLCFALITTVVGAAELVEVLAANFPYRPALPWLLADAAAVFALVVVLLLLPQPASTASVTGTAARRLIRFTFTPSGLELGLYA
jgi:hypothetical protein